MNDPLLAFVPMPFQQCYFPCGFPVRIWSNVQTVLEAAQQSWGACQQRFEASAIEARYLVCNGPRRRSPNPVFRAQSNLLTMVADEHNYACCDLERGFGSAWLTEATINNVDFFRYTFLEGLVYCLIESLYLTPIHGACVIRHGRGVLLTAESGMGKSSLAYACARRGWTYVSDDASSLIRSGSGRTVIGNPRLFRFRLSAADLFPELKEKLPVAPQRVKFRRGKPTLEIRTDSLEGIATAEEATVDHVIFLKRDPQMGESARIAPVARETAIRRLTPNVWPVELAVHQQRSAAIERLLEGNLAELTYWNFAPAIDALEELVGRDF
jgi:HPr Serine kinase C-terminal domain